MRFRLTATCPDGSQATDETGTITIVNVNRPPVAYASPAPAIAFQGDLITLRSTAPSGAPASNDPDDDALVYQWTQTPPGPGVTLTGANTATATFTAPAAGGDYTLQFRLLVRDRPSGGLTSTASVVVNVTSNLPPLAMLQCPESVNEGNPVLLDGRGSNDPNGQPLTYAWTQLLGTPSIVVGGETGNTVAFNAPTLTTGQDGFVEFELKVTDTQGLWDLATCMLEIRDVTRPVISVPALPPFEATSSAGSLVTYGVSAVDNVDGDVSSLVVCVPPSGSIFGLGTNAVDCEVEDSIGNTGIATFFVTVRDTTPPVIDPRDDIVDIEATGPDGAAVIYNSPATHDLVDSDGEASCLPASGSIFGLGTTQVTCSAVDAAGNPAVNTHFNVTVVDTTPPTIDPHGNVGPIEATSSLGAQVFYTSPATHDVVDPDGTATCTPTSGSIFALGDTTVTCTASDTAGNAAVPSHFNVTVVDTTAPVVIAPANVTAEATGPLTHVAHGMATASDAVGVVSLTNNAPATFPLGTTTITWTATDAAGNSASATSTVTVVDTTAPAVSVPATIVSEATSAAGAAVSFSASAIDLVYGNVAVSCAPASGSTFALGTTTATCSATDGSGNTGQASFAITVRDTTAPVISYYPGDISAIAGGNSSAVVNYTQPTAWDIVDGAVAVNCSPASGSSFPVGSNTVSCSAKDSRGNTATGSFTVTVSYAWNGFFKPVDMWPVLNSSKAGSAIPLKFSLGGNQGMSIMAAGYPKSAPMSCGGAAEDPLLETVTAGQSSLQYDASANQYIYVWKSEKSWAGTCRQIQVKLIDGTVHTANFSFK
ncbi:MAG TPA: HYR domain-containing protein [Lysobacter sp.]|nr:HYR domain-containing protein [Lysobacter sp.]